MPLKCQMNFIWHENCLNKSIVRKLQEGGRIMNVIGMNGKNIILRVDMNVEQVDFGNWRQLSQKKAAISLRLMSFIRRQRTRCEI